MIYKKNEFLIDNIKTSVLAKKYATPLYCYSFKKLKHNILNFKKNFKSIKPIICFSVKSNPNKTLLGEIGKLGLGADVVSIGELMKSLKSFTFLMIVIFEIPPIFRKQTGNLILF